jgi:hypothetical protein
MSTEQWWNDNQKGQPEETFASECHTKSPEAAPRKGARAVVFTYTFMRSRQRVVRSVTRVRFNMGRVGLCSRSSGPFF